MMSQHAAFRPVQKVFVCCHQPTAEAPAYKCCHKSAMWYHSEAFQAAAALALVIIAALIPQKKMATAAPLKPLKAWVRLLLEGGKSAGSAVEGNASLRWLNAGKEEHNVKGHVWLETLYNSPTGTMIRLGYDGFDPSTGELGSQFIHWPRTWIWTQTKVKSNNSKARIVQLHFQSNEICTTDILLTFPISNGLDDGDLFVEALKLAEGGTHYDPHHEVFGRTTK